MKVTSYPTLDESLDSLQDDQLEKRQMPKKTYLQRRNRIPKFYSASNRNETAAPLREVVEAVQCRKPFRRALQCEGATISRLEAREGAGMGVCGR